MAGTPLVPILHGVDCLPEYFIIGGVVFIPLSLPLLEHAYGKVPVHNTNLKQAIVLQILHDTIVFLEFCKSCELEGFILWKESKDAALL